MAEKVSAHAPDKALFTHHHYGWRKHDIASDSDADVLAALLSSHGFLKEFEGRYRAEIKRTPERPQDGHVLVFWDAEEPKADHYGPPLRRSDHWFTLDGFNLAGKEACRHCGGTGVDHYNFFYYCWACDGTAKQKRTGAPAQKIPRQIKLPANSQPCRALLDKAERG